MDIPPLTPPGPLVSTPKSKWKPFLLIGSSLLILAVVAVFIFLFNAGIFKHTVSAASTPYFSVISVSPTSDSQNNDPMAPITITFSQPVDPQTLHGYFTINPMVPGTFTQGTTSEQVVFTPKFTLGKGTSVRVILNHGFHSTSGALFASDYSYNFYTIHPEDSISFNIGNTVSILNNALPNKKVDIGFSVGSSIDPNWHLVIYRGSLDELLKSLSYTNTANPGSAYVSQNFIGNPIDTSQFQQVASTTGLGNDASYTFNEGPGLYYIEAISQGSVVGYTWINVTDQGLVTRQDDQGVYIAAQNVQTGNTDENIQASLYNLENTPTVLGTATVSNTTSNIPITYPESADLIVGKTSEGLILVPLNVPETEADKRVNSNLTKRGNIYLYTDKPTYQTNDTVQFAGIARVDNDAQYSLPSSGDTVHVWSALPGSATSTLVDMHIPVNADGSFSGTFRVPVGAVTDANYPEVTLYARLDSDPTIALSLASYATFDVKDTPDTGLLNVSYSESQYTQGQKIVAHIAGTDTTGKPLANQKVIYDEYMLNYDPADPSSVASFGSNGGNRQGGDQTVTLDQNGQATFTLTPDVTVSSKALTIDAHTTINGTDTHGAKTVLIRQGNIILSFGSGRVNYQDGDTTAIRVYARDLSGSPIQNQKISYRLYYSVYDNNSQGYDENNVSSGSVMTDSNGLAVIRVPVSLASSSSLYMEVSTVDSSGSRVSTNEGLTVNPVGYVASNYYYHAPELTNFDVAMDKQTYEVGDTANLTITSPFEQNVWVTFQRGRVYQSQWMHLMPGANQLQISITQKLAPSFDVDFSYYRNGTFNSEGLTVPVDTSANRLSISVGPDKSSYNSGDAVTLAIGVRNASGIGIPAHVSLAIVNERVFNLRDVMSSGDMFWHYFIPRIDTTTLSSSLLGIGTGNGCGGGSGNDYPYIPNRLGTTIYWNPDASTNQSGLATFNVSLPASGTGNYRILVRAWSGNDLFGQSQSTLIVQQKTSQK